MNFITFSKFLLLVFFTVSCSTSTQTKSAPAAAMSAIELASGNRPSGWYAGDGKYQISVEGNYSENISCAILRENLLVQIAGPLPGKKVLNSLKIDEDGKFSVITNATPGVIRSV